MLSLASFAITDSTPPTLDGHECPFCMNETPYPFPEPVANVAGGVVSPSNAGEPVQRRRRQMKRERNRLKLGKWWKSYGYNGPKYCQRCSEIFRDHIMRELSNSANCKRNSPCVDCQKVLEHFPNPRTVAYEGIDLIGKKREEKARKKSSRNGNGPAAGAARPPFIPDTTIFHTSSPLIAGGVSPPLPLTATATSFNPTGCLVSVPAALAPLSNAPAPGPSISRDVDPSYASILLTLSSMTADISSDSAESSEEHDYNVDDSGYSSSSSDSASTSGDWPSDEGSYSSSSAAASVLDEPLCLPASSNRYYADRKRNASDFSKESVHRKRPKKVQNKTVIASLLGVSLSVCLFVFALSGYPAQDGQQSLSCAGGAVIGGTVDDTCAGELGDECAYRCPAGFGQTSKHVCTRSGRFEGGRCALCSDLQFSSDGVCMPCTTCVASVLQAPDGLCSGFLDTFCMERNSHWTQNVLNEHSAATDKVMDPPIVAFPHAWTGLDGTLWMFGGWTESEDTISVSGDQWYSELPHGDASRTWSKFVARTADGSRPMGLMGSVSWQKPDGTFFLFGGSTEHDSWTYHFRDHSEEISPFVDQVSGTTVFHQHNQEQSYVQDVARWGDANEDRGQNLGQDHHKAPLDNETAAHVIQEIFKTHQHRSGLVDSNELWSFDGVSWTLNGGTPISTFDSSRMTMDISRLDGSYYTDYQTLIWAGSTPWPQGRSFGLGWGRRHDALIFGGLLKVRYYDVPRPNATTKWLMNDLWQYNSSDGATPWKLLGGAGVETGADLLASLSATRDLVLWPSARMHAVGWVSSADDSAWMFGGILGCCDTTHSPRPGGSLRNTPVSALSNQLWRVSGNTVSLLQRYDPTQGWIRGVVSRGLSWELMSGAANLAGQGSDPGATLRPSLASGWAPEPRAGAATWHDTSGRPWMFGGFATGGKCDLADLWTLDGHDGLHPRWLRVRNVSQGSAWPAARFGAATWRDQHGLLIHAGAAWGSQCDASLSVPPASHSSAKLGSFSVQSVQKSSLLEGAMDFLLTQRSGLQDYQRFPEQLRAVRESDRLYDSNLWQFDETIFVYDDGDKT
eukprot:SAG11_NODE_365_length_10153_cov_3.204695_3_plen_1077_part_00